MGSMTVTSTVGAAQLLSVPGVLAKVLLNTAPGGTVKFYDGLLADTSGPLLGYIPATDTVGSFYAFGVPFANGLVINQSISATTLSLFFTLV